MSIKDRLWAKIDKSGGCDACWPWTGCVDDYGYGMIKGDDNRTRRAHRVVLELSGSVISSGTERIAHLR